jgi:two-component system, OmpR family, alkaline phosphatase synthesis response regulator PhoP
MSYRVLLCDDEVHILRAAEFKLSRAGYEVRCATNGLEAWDEIQRQKPDVLVTDCQMPRLDGLGLCEKIRQQPELHDLPIFMLTAKGYELSTSELKEKFGILQIIAKPFSPRELLRSVDEVCQRRVQGSGFGVQSAGFGVQDSASLVPNFDTSIPDTL